MFSTARFSVIVMILFAATAFAQTVTILDAESGAPLAGVRITAAGRSVITGPDGGADISTLLNAETLVFRKDGYQRRALSPADLARDQYRVRLSATVFSQTITVTGVTRREQDEDQVSQRVVSIGRDEVALTNPQTAADMLGATGEVYIQKSQLAGGSPMMRGFATNRVLLVIDGVRMNTAMFREGNVQNVISLNPEAMETTEVIFGPGSVMYGSDAIGGVMAFTTAAPVLSATDVPLVVARGGMRASSANGEKSGHLEFAYGGHTWGSLTSVGYSNFGDLRMGGDGPDEYLRTHYVVRRDGQDLVVANDDPDVQSPSGYWQANLMQKFRFAPSDDWDITYGFHFATTSNLPRYDRLIEVRNGALRFAEWYYGPQDWAMHNLAVRSSGATTLYDSAAITVAFQQFTESRHDRRFGQATRTSQKENLDAWSFNLDLDKDFGERQELFYGFEAVHNRVHSDGSQKNIVSGLESDAATRYPDGAEWQSLAIYLNYVNRFDERITLTAGARYNRIAMNAAFDDVFYDFPVRQLDSENDAFTGSIGIVWRPDGDWRLAATLATGFRAPNIDDAGKVFESAPGLVIVPNPDLKPEYARSLDFTIGRTFGDVAELEATAFYTLLEDAMVRSDATLNGQEYILYQGELSRVQSLQNAYEAEAYGAQISGRAVITPHLTLRADHTWIRGETDSGEALRHVPPDFGLVQLAWVRGPLTLDLSLAYNEEIPADRLSPSERDKPHLYRLDAEGRPYCPGWAILSLEGAWALNQQFSITAGIENIADRRYRPYSSGIVAGGRNFILGLRWSM